MLTFDLNKLIDSLFSLKDDKYRKFQSRMLKMHEGGIIGVRVPILRKFAYKYENINIYDIEPLLRNKFHDLRFLALLLLIRKFDLCMNDKKQIVNFYLDNIKYIDNWDLVDLSSHRIMGSYFNSDDGIFDELSFSDNVWAARIAMVATWSYIKNNNFSLTIKLAERYLLHKSETIHKASGWMLREIGKRDKSILINFLNKFYKKMPRIMFRYSVEKLSEQDKAKYFY